MQHDRYLHILPQTSGTLPDIEGAGGSNDGWWNAIDTCSCTWPTLTSCIWIISTWPLWCDDFERKKLSDLTNGIISRTHGVKSHKAIAEMGLQ
jgi:hypothetical protein